MVLWISQHSFDYEDNTCFLRNYHIMIDALLNSGHSKKAIFSVKHRIWKALYLAKYWILSYTHFKARREDLMRTFLSLFSVACAFVYKWYRSSKPKHDKQTTCYTLNDISKLSSSDILFYYFNDISSLSCPICWYFK